MLMQVRSVKGSFKRPVPKLSALVGPQNQRTWWQKHVASPFGSSPSSTSTAANLSTHEERQVIRSSPRAHAGRVVGRGTRA